MEIDVLLKELLEKGKKGYVLVGDITKYFSEDSEEYGTIEEELNKHEIAIYQDDDMVDTKLDDDIVVSDTFSPDLEEEVDIDHFDTLPPSVRLDDPVRMYLKEIGNITLLSLEDEKKYAKEVYDGQQAQIKEEEFSLNNNYSEGLNKYLDLKDDNDEKLLSKSKEDEIISEYPYMEEYIKLEHIIETAEIAKNRLVEANLRLVVSIAKKYIGRGLQFLDLIQEGNMGLMKAVDKFEFEQGYKFSTYATWWIRQAITRAVADQARTIRIPVHMVETINKLVRVQRQLLQELSREPSPEEVAERMQIPVEKVQSIQKIAQEPISLEQPVGEEEDSSLGDFVADQNALDPYEYTAKAKLREELDAVLAMLTDREERVLRLRFGLADGRIRTLEEVGKEFGVTRERIRQIESKALRKLKHPSRSRKLKDFLLKQ